MSENSFTELIERIFNVRTVAAALLTSAIIYWLVNRIGREGLVIFPDVKSLWYIVGIGSLSLGFPFLVAIRWSVVLNSIGYPLHFSNCLQLVLASFAINPLTVSKTGDFLKVFFLRGQIPAGESTGSIIIEKMLDLSTVLFLGFIGSIYINSLRLAIFCSIFLIIITLFVFSTPILLLLARVFLRWGKYLSFIANLNKRATSDPKMVIQALAISFVIRILSFLQIYCVSQGLNYNLSLVKIVATFSVSICIGLLPITLSGAGTRDASIMFLLNPVLSSAQSLMLGISYTIFNYVIPAVLGIPVLIWLLIRGMSLGMPADVE